MTAQLDFHRLVLVPLTPIHIGGGEEARLLPEDYRLNGSMVERVNVRAVLARLPADERERLIRDFDRNPEGFIRSLQQKAGAEDVIERIPISRESAGAVDLGGEGHGRRNQIDAFIRAGAGPFLPGSTLKGALRTAWLLTIWKLRERKTGARPFEGRSARDLEVALFDLERGNAATDTDPMRDVTVRDAPLPQDATRIDKVLAWKRGADGYGFSQTGEIHRERLRAVIDGDAPPLIEVEIGLRSEAVRRGRVERAADRRAYPRTPPSQLSILLASLEAQHAPLWKRELEKFFAGETGLRLQQALALFDGLARGGNAPAAALVRLGWGAHAEAKSLEPVRRIERPQVRGSGRHAKEGSARHVLNIGGAPAPFGWALLVRKEAWEAKQPVSWLAEPPASGSAPRIGVAGRPASTPRPTLANQVKYRAGDKVLVDGEEATLAEDVTAMHKPDDEVMADFGDGPEPIRVGEIEELA